MIQVEQTLHLPPDGNCFAACVASVLELSLETVPNCRSDRAGWWFEWQEWLGKRNLAMIGFVEAALDAELRADILRGYSICTVRYGNEDAGMNHSVVALDGEIVWNPSPLRETAKPDAVLDWIVFRLLDPSKCTKGANHATCNTGFTR